MNRNKILPISLLIILSLLFTACSSSTTEDSKAENTKVANSSPSTTDHKEAHWSYEGKTGPEHWSELDQANAACVNGSEQSPINIETANTKKDNEAEKLEINYVPTTFSIQNNGHTIQGNPKTDSNSIVLGDDKYNLAQFHFHTPSEHQVNGDSFAMELHLVHKDADNELAVLGLLIKEGKENANFKETWASLPKEQTKEDINLKEQIDLTNILPNNQQSFRYDGSLTTPSCSEGVEWIVLEEPIEMSKEQIKMFQDIFPDNHRPVQNLNEREVVKF